MSDTPPPPPQAPWQPAGDARSAKAQAKASKAHAKALRPWYKKKRFILGGLLLLLVLGGIASAAGSKKSDDKASPPTSGGTRSVQAKGSSAAASDVEVTACENDPTTNLGSVKVKVTNHSSKASNYLITVTVSSADGATQIGTGNAAVQSLNADQSTQADAIITKQIPADAKCEVSDVLRTAASGG